MANKKHIPTSLATHKAHPGKPLPFLTDFCRNPQGISFENQQADEQILLFIRAHFITNVPWVFLVALFALLPVFLPFILSQFAQALDLSFIGTSYYIIGFLFYYLFLLWYSYIRFITWFYNIGIITIKRIVDIDFSYAIYKNVASAPIESVEDVEYHQGGFFKNFFDYGDVLIQTEGVKANFEFKSVPRPGRVADVILDVKEAHGKND